MQLFISINMLIYADEAGQFIDFLLHVIMTS